jgi:L-fuculose-phosphate aldolase
MLAATLHSYNSGMERVKRALALVPELYAQGLLDASGGNFAVRGTRGIYVTPSLAGEQMRWRITLEDMVLFPGPSDASMARAGRRPSRENRLHRAILAARPDWNFSLHCHTWGLLAFALAEKPLTVSEHHAHLIRRSKETIIPALPTIPLGVAQLADAVVKLVAETYANCEHGAVLLDSHGVLVAGVEVETVLSLLTSLENVARAQQWRLKPV